MLSEYFINEAIKFCLCAPFNITNKKLFSDLDHLHQINHEEMQEGKLANTLSDKFNFSKYLAIYRLNQKDLFDKSKLKDNIKNGEFKHFESSIDIYESSLSETDCDNFTIFISKKKKIASLLNGKQDLVDRLNKIENGSYQDDDEQIKLWEECVSGLYKQLYDIKKIENLKNITNFDSDQEDYGAVLKQIKERKSKHNALKTGIRVIDDVLPSGGLEATRLYLFGGTSGVGKSILLINFLVNAVLNTPAKKNGEEKDVHLYVTLENLVDETLERIFCCATGMPVEEFDKACRKDSFDLKVELNKIFSKCGAKYVIVYCKPKLTRVDDVEYIIDTLPSTASLKGLYLDYLDLLKGYQKGYDDYRHDLGDITIGLKTIAVVYRIPVATVTQLNRRGYESGKEASLVQMSESMLKIDNSDFCAFLQTADKMEASTNTSNGILYYKQVRCSILKNRNGLVGVKDILALPISLNGRKIFSYKYKNLPGKYYTAPSPTESDYIFSDENVIENQKSKQIPSALFSGELTQVY